MKNLNLFIAIVLANIALGIGYTNYNSSSEVNSWVNQKTEEKSKISWFEEDEPFRKMTPEELKTLNSIDELFSVAPVRDMMFVVYVFSFIGVFIVGCTDIKKLMSTDFYEQEPEVWNAFISAIMGVFAFISCQYASRGGWEAFSFSMIMVVTMAAILVIMRKS